jgi:hypothetical protein
LAHSFVSCVTPSARRWHQSGDTYIFLAMDRSCLQTHATFFSFLVLTLIVCCGVFIRFTGVGVSRQHANTLSEERWVQATRYSRDKHETSRFVDQLQFRKDHFSSDVKPKFSTAICYVAKRQDTVCSNLFWASARATRLVREKGWRYSWLTILVSRDLVPMTLTLTVMLLWCMDAGYGRSVSVWHVVLQVANTPTSTCTSS